MPLRDGTGPRASGRGRGCGRRVRGVGQAGRCTCVACGITVDHQAGIPCSSMKCQHCGGMMTRQKGNDVRWKMKR